MIKNYKRTTTIYAYLIVLLLQALICNAQSKDETINYGLSFFSHSVNQDKRTSLDLIPDKTFSFPDEGFSLSFDIRLKDELYTYGYVARIVSDNVASFDVISYLLKKKLNFVLVDKDKTLANIGITDSMKIVADKWMHVKIQFSRNNISIGVDDTKLNLAHSFNGFKNIKIYFGKNKDTSFYTTDVPPMTIRNIAIADHTGKALYNWDLKKHNKYEVFDNIKGYRALVENGNWEIDKHTKWSKVTTLAIPQKNPQIAYDNTAGRVFVVSDTKLYTYSVRNNAMDTAFVAKGQPYSGVASQIIYDEKNGRLISYNPNFLSLNTYNFEKREWSEDKTILIETKQHHNRVIDKQHNRLIIFGGYGDHKYNSELCTISLDSISNTWHCSSLNNIVSPRYLSAMGWEDSNNLLIIGGHGSLSGKQEESPRNFYDLYRLNVSTGKCTKVWDMPSPKSHFAFGNSLIADTASNSIYALTYKNDRFNTHIYLSRFDLNTKTPDQYIMSDSIEYNFLDIRSYCDLFFDKRTSSLYAIVQQEKVPGTTTIDIYNLAFPPLSKEDTMFQPAPSINTPWLVYGITLIIVLSIGITFYFINKKKRERKHQQTTSDAYANTTISIKSTAGKKRIISTILFLGGFQVFDKDGDDMTKEFTPTLKLLFLFLFLNSIKNGKGITSQRLDDTFWFDMDKAKAMNNRNVNIRKLRLILEKIGNINIANKGGYWFLEIGKEIICDYEEVTKGLAIARSNKGNVDKDSLIRIVDFASAGALLPNVDSEWIDEYKSEYSTLITETMLNITNSSEIKEDNRLLLKIADTILISDSIDEDAIRMKCKILFQMGQKGLSKQSYDKFAAEYNRLLNTSPDLKYEDIIN